jgi:hypothetical protein
MCESVRDRVGDTQRRDSKEKGWWMRSFASDSKSEAISSSSFFGRLRI